MTRLLERLFGRNSPDPVSLILLQTAPIVLTRGHVARAVSQATGLAFIETGVTQERFSYHRLHVDGYELTIMSTEVPYLSKDGSPHPDLRLADAIQRHEAAILVDCWAAPSGKERIDAMGLMGKIIASLADETSLGVYCFHTQRLNVVDQKLLGMLESGRALEAMEGRTFDRVVGVEAQDAAMEGAMREARRRWPEFVSAFANHAEDSAFIVKARFGQGERIEHMWLSAIEVDANGVTGILRSNPFRLPRPRKDDRVRVELGEISDWIFTSEGETIGSFTDRALPRSQEM